MGLQQIGPRQWAVFWVSSGCSGKIHLAVYHHGAVSANTGGLTPNPTYEEVCSGMTGHNEVVSGVFEPGTGQAWTALA